MTFAEKLQLECSKRGLYANGVCTKLGFSRGAFTYWKKSGKAPNDEQIQKFAEELGMTYSDLMTEVNGVSARYGGIIATASNCEQVSLSNQEKEIIDIYRAMGLKKQMKFLQALIELSDEA